MIKSFKCKETKKIHEGSLSKKFPNSIQRKARIKLRLLNRALSLDILFAIPGLRLEKLKGNRKEQYSVRINNQWRICFRWNESNAYNVEIIDYH